MEVKGILRVPVRGAEVARGGLHVEVREAPGTATGVEVLFWVRGTIDTARLLSYVERLLDNWLGKANAEVASVFMNYDYQADFMSRSLPLHQIKYTLLLLRGKKKFFDVVSQECK